MKQYIEIKAKENIYPSEAKASAGAMDSKLSGEEVEAVGMRSRAI